MSNNSQIMIPDEIVMQKIYRIRGKNVMLDQDLAELYDVKTNDLMSRLNAISADSQMTFCFN
jgi:hypothetical protein